MSESKYLFDNKMNEECGVFAVFNHEDAALLTYYGLHALQHRGQEGCGIVTSNGEELKGHKGLGLVQNVFGNEEIKSLKGKHAIGHVRYATAGGGGYSNVQPFLFKSSTGDLGLAHNGNLVNAKPLREKLEQDGSIFQTTSDSEIVAHFVKKNTNNLLESIKDSLCYLEGAFAFVFLEKDALYIALDRLGMRPLSIGELDGAYIVSSETCAFNVIGAKHLEDVKPGEVIKITDQGIEKTKYASDCKHTICSMEYVYFARPDSDIEGVNVHVARVNSGKQLAKEHNDVKADIVIGVPDSGLSAAIGYSQESGIPLETGLIKNKYSKRTFIEPNQKMREIGVKMKLSAVPAVVKDKSVILVDDSLVRGTTSKEIVNMLKDSGAKEVHVRIAAPEITSPCFYGVDFSTYDELISATKTNEEITDIIGATSLKFLSLDGMVTSYGRGEQKGKYCGQCVACFNGDYPTHLYEAIEKMNKEVK